MFTIIAANVLYFYYIVTPFSNFTVSSCPNFTHNYHSTEKRYLLSKVVAYFKMMCPISKNTMKVATKTP